MDIGNAILVTIALFVILGFYFMGSSQGSSPSSDAQVKSSPNSSGAQRSNVKSEAERLRRVLQGHNEFTWFELESDGSHLIVKRGVDTQSGGWYAKLTQAEHSMRVLGDQMPELFKSLRAMAGHAADVLSGEAGRPLPGSALSSSFQFKTAHPDPLSYVLWKRSVDAPSGSTSHGSSIEIPASLLPDLIEELGERLSADMSKVRSEALDDSGLSGLSDTATGRRHGGDSEEGAVRGDRNLGWYFTSFRGRISRAEWFGYGLLFNVGLFIAAFALLAWEPASSWLDGVRGSAYLGLVVLNAIGAMALHVKRFHDFDAPGWLVILLLIPFVHMAVALLLLVLSGTSGANRHGPPVKASE